MDLKELEAMLRKTVGEELAARITEMQAKSIERKHTQDLGGQSAANADSTEPTEKGLKMSRYLRHLYAAKGNPNLVPGIAEKAGDKWMAKALGESTLAGGGAWVPPGWSNEIIDLLTAKAVVRKAGAVSTPMPNGSLTMPFLASGASAAYVGESTNIPKSEQTGGQLQLSDKKLAALVPISNDLLRSGGTRVEQLIRNDIVRALALKEDVTFLRSAGASGEPKGMLYWADTANKFNANATVNVANVTADLTEAIYRLEQQNVDLAMASWFISARSKKYLISARDGNNNLVWAEEMSKAGTIFGIPFQMSTQIPNNLGSSESEVYLAAMDLIVIAEKEGIMVEMFPDGTYHDGSAVQSGISRDESVIRSIALHDFGCRQRGKEVAVIQQVKWGV